MKKFYDRAREMTELRRICKRPLTIPNIIQTKAYAMCIGFFVCIYSFLQKSLAESNKSLTFVVEKYWNTTKILL